MMKHKKIAILVHGLYGGGMERVAAQLSIMLSDAGCDTYLIVGGFNKRETYQYKGKIITIPFNLNRQQSMGRAFAVMLYNAYLLRKCKIANQFDVTISFAPEMNMANMFSGTRDKKIVTIHSCLSVRNDLKGLYYKRNLYKMYNHAYKVIAVSKWCREELIDHYGIKRDKVKVIYNPVQNSSRKYISTAKENIVLVVGRLQDIKQQWHIIRAFKTVLAKVPDAKLVIVGQGENRSYLGRLAKDMDIDDKIFFKGFVKKIDMLYQQAKCVVFSSASEAFPCSVIEAMSYGVPVAAADCPGGMREILAGDLKLSHQVHEVVVVKGGVLTPRLDGIKYDGAKALTRAERKLAEGIIYLLQNETDYANLVKNCFEISQLFHEKIMKRKWMLLIASVIKGIGR